MTKSTITRERIAQIANPDSWVKCTHEEVQELDRMALAAMDSEPDCNERQLFCSTDTARMRKVISVSTGTGDAQFYRHAQPAPVVQCPFPCGWDNLNKLAIQDAALVARGLVEGELTTEAHRQAAISNNDRLLKVISACRAAMLQAGNYPVIPDDSASMLRRWLAFGRGMQNAGSQLPHNLIAETEEMLAAADCSVPMISDRWIPVSEQKPDCWCLTCRPVTLNDMRFVVCPDCGNKRCPRANDHRNACTGSNEPGQEGSAYPDTLQEPKP